MIKFCKICGKPFYTSLRGKNAPLKCRRLGCRRRYRAEYAQQWEAENKEKVSAWSRGRYERNKQKRKRQVREWQLKNQDRVRALLKNLGRKYRDGLADNYVAQCLRRRGTCLNGSKDNFPPELIALKREHLKLKRAIWKIRDNERREQNPIVERGPRTAGGADE